MLDTTQLKDEVRQIIDSVGEETVAYIIYLLKNEDKVASGNLLKSFNYKLVEDISNTFLSIESSADYADVVDKGRKAGSYPPPSKIEQWIKQRGIQGRDKKGRFISNKSLSFLISRNIYKFGIKPTNFSTKAMDYAQRRLIEELSNLKSLEDIFDVSLLIKA